jgi:hypothetical protein
MLGHSHASVWRTKDGREIPIYRMEDAHLLNTIAYLRKRIPLRKAVAELKLLHGHDFVSGDGAHDALSYELITLERMSNEAFLASVTPQYPTLLAEARKRKLDVPAFDEAEADRQRCSFQLWALSRKDPSEFVYLDQTL